MADSQADGVAGPDDGRDTNAGVVFGAFVVLVPHGRGLARRVGPNCVLVARLEANGDVRRRSLRIT